MGAVVGRGGAGHKGHYSYTFLCCVMMCHNVPGCVTLHWMVLQGRTELSSDNPVITLSISSLTAATVGSGMSASLSKKANPKFS